MNWTLIFFQSGDTLQLSGTLDLQVVETLFQGLDVLAVTHITEPERSKSKVIRY